MRPQSLFAGILILGLMIIWEVEFFVLDIWPRFKAQAAEAPKMVINEIAWMGTDTSPNDEWIELFNNTGAELNLTGWILKAGDGIPNIGLSGTMPSQEYFLLERTSDDPLPNLQANQIYTGALGNSGEELALYDDQNNLIDQTPKIANSKWPAGDNDTKQTMERKNSLEVGDNPLNWQTSQNPGGTPKAKNSEEPESPPEEPSAPPENPENPPNPTAPNIIINELFPNPKGEEKEQEFIELKNLSDFMAYLIGWQIKDKSGKTYEFILEKIPPQGLLTLFYEQSKIQLNNTGGEEIFLYDNYGHPVDSISYQEADEGYSYNFTDQGWLWSSTTTPGLQNRITTETTVSETPPTFPRHIWISEFLPNPAGKDTENEFIEIYNKGPNEIDLENWQIDDCEDKGSKPHPFPENKKIAGGEYLSLPYSETKIALNNDEDCVRLLWPNGAAIDEMEYGDPPEGESYNKINDRWCWSTGPTPGEQNNCSNESQEKKEYSRKIWINEILPNPEGKDENGEFIELQNRGDEEINLENWQIDDCEDKGSRPYTFPENTKIKAAGYLVLYYQDTKINLNNDGDCARLITPEGQAIDEITYGKSSEGQSYSRQNLNHWQWTIPSAGQDNNFPQVLESATAPLSPGKTNPESPVLPQTGPNLKFYIHASIAISISRFTFKKWGVKIKAKLNLK